MECGMCKKRINPKSADYTSLENTNLQKMKNTVYMFGCGGYSLNNRYLERESSGGQERRLPGG